MNKLQFIAIQPIALIYVMIGFFHGQLMAEKIVKNNK
jgi:hypothetical protein